MLMGSACEIQVLRIEIAIPIKDLVKLGTANLSASCSTARGRDGIAISFYIYMTPAT